MSEHPLANWLDQTIHGDCLEVLQSLPAESVDLIFADPPYNLQLQGELLRPNLSRVQGVDEDWDKFENLKAYDEFTEAWLSACRRVLKPTGTLWVIGSYHNIYRVGSILQDLGYWILNDVVWVKSNPMPNFRGVRFTNAHETLIWAQKEKGARYTFNYQAMKMLNDDLQMRSDWFIPICTGKERLRENDKRLHPTQKPEALLYRILMASTNPGDVVLDPFFGTGTTGMMACKLSRHYIGIEIDARYVHYARERLSKNVQYEFDAPLLITPNPRSRKRIPFGSLVEQGYIRPGTQLSLGDEKQIWATVQADGALVVGSQRGSIHALAREILGRPANGWMLWHYWDEASQSHRKIDEIRKKYREDMESDE